MAVNFSNFGTWGVQREDIEPEADVSDETKSWLRKTVSELIVQIWFRSQVGLMTSTNAQSPVSGPRRGKESQECS